MPCCMGGYEVHCREQNRENNKAPQLKGFIINALRHYLAEREGFEPSVRLNTAHSLSRRARSTTPAPLRDYAGRAAILGDRSHVINELRCEIDWPLAEYGALGVSY